MPTGHKPSHHPIKTLLIRPKMSMPMMFTQANQPLAQCEVCGEPVEALQQKVQLQKRTIHKECFKCAICEKPLQAGSCTLDHALSRYFGPLWFCQAHMMLGSGKKHEMLKQKYRTGK